MTLSSTCTVDFDSDSQFANDIYKMLSYRTETALQGALVLAKGGRLELEFYGHYRSIFNHCDIIGLQSYHIR